MENRLTAQQPVSPGHHPLYGLLPLSPVRTDLLKTLALLAMLADHVNIVLFNEAFPLLYAAGRMAFPLFTLIWAMNLKPGATDLQQQADRLWRWALLTQPCFVLAFMTRGQSWLALNILFVFAGCTQALAWYVRHGTRGAAGGALLLAILAWPLTAASYGLEGLVFAVLCVAACRCPGLVSPPLWTTAFVLSLLSLNGTGMLATWPAGALLYAMLPTLVLPAAAVWAVRYAEVRERGRFWPRRFFYHAYAGHLLVLGLVAVPVA